MKNNKIKNKVLFFFKKEVGFLIMTWLLARQNYLK